MKTKPIRKRKRGVNPRQRKAESVYLETGSKTLACQAVGVDPRHSDRLLNTAAVQADMIRQLDELNLGPGFIASRLRDAGFATMYLSSELAEQAYHKARDSRRKQLLMLDPITNQPRLDLPGVVPDQGTRLRAVELIAKYRGIGAQDPEYGKRMFESGMEAAGQQYVELIEKLRPHLSADGQAVLEQGVRSMSGKN